MTDDETILWRLARLEEQVREKADADDVRALAEEMRAVRRALWGFAFSILVATLTFALTVAQLSAA